MLERAIIDHASPTLARLKLGNLFNYPVNENFDTEFAGLQAMLAGKGVALSCTEGNAGEGARLRLSGGWIGKGAAQ